MHFENIILPIIIILISRNTGSGARPRVDRVAFWQSVGSLRILMRLFQVRGAFFFLLIWVGFGLVSRSIPLPSEKDNWLRNPVTCSITTLSSPFAPNFTPIFTQKFNIQIQLWKIHVNLLNNNLKLNNYWKIINILFYR